MPGSVLTYTIKADTSQMAGEVKRAGAALDGLGGSAMKSASESEKAERKFMGLAKGLGLELSGAASATIGKLEALERYLIRTHAPAADLEKVTTALATAQNRYTESLKGGTGAASSFAPMLGNISKAAGLVGLTFGAWKIAAIVGDAVGAAKDFDASWSRVNVILRNTPTEQVSQFQKQILELPSSFGSAADNAKAFYQIISSGISDPTKALTLLKDAAIAAAGGFTTTETAVRAGTAVLNAYGLDVDKARHIFDVMAKTVDLGVISFEELATQLGSVIPIAAANKVSFEDLSAAVAALTLQGVSGGEAITGLRSLIVSMISPSEQAAKVAKYLGIEWNAQALQSKGLDGMLQQLVGNTKVTTEAISLLTGRVEATNAAMALTRDGGKRLSEQMIEISKASNGAGASQESFAKAMESATSAGSNLITTFKNLASSIGKEVSPFMASFLRQIDVFTQVSAAAMSGNAMKIVTILKDHFGGAVKSVADDINGKFANAVNTQFKNANPIIETTTKKVTDLSDATKNKLVPSQDAAKKSLTEQIKAMDEQGKAVEKTAEKMKKLETQYASTTGKVLMEIAAIQQDIKFMEQHRVSTDAMSTAKEKLGQKTFELIAVQSKHPELLKKIDVALQSVNVHLVGERSAVELITVAYGRFRDEILAFSQLDFGTVMISNNATLAAAADRADEATVAWGKMNEMIKIKTPEALAPAKQSFEDMGRQVSTVVTDMFKGIADALVHWQGFGKSMIKVAQEFGSGILRTLMESWFKPMEKELAKIATKITDALGGLFGGTTSGGAPGAKFSWNNLLKDLGIGALIAGAGVAISSIVSKFTQRGRDKTTATGGAQEVSANVWGTVADVKAGNLSVSEGIAAVNQAWANYEKFLRENLKDQTVIQRSLDTQRATLTEGLAALETIRQGLDEEAKAANEALEKLRIEKAVEKLQALGAQFIETGKMSEDFAKAVTDAGGSVEFFNKMAGEVERLQGLRQELGSLKQMIDSLLPPTKTWQQQFFETGEITEEMAEKIRAAGGDLNQFKKFADMKGVKTQFESLVDEFSKTGVASDKLLEMIKEFGGADAIKAFEDLRAEASKSGKSIGELAKDSEGSAKIIQDALGATAGGINKAFGDAAQQLSDTLAKMDENLGKAIADLQSAMVTMIKDLIDVLLGVPGAAENAAKHANFFLGTIKAPDIRINITTHFDDSGLREAERRAAALAAIGFGGQPDIFNPVDSGTGRSGRDLVSGGRIPGFASGTDYVPRTGLAMVHQGESIIPAGQNKGGGDTVLNFYGDIVANNPEELLQQLERRLQTNAAGSRGRIKKALRLKQPGTF